MKKLFAILLTLAMLLSLAACGGGEEAVEDPNLGKYLGVSASVMGFTMDMSEVYPGETWIQLKSGGKGTIMLDGDDFSIKWALEEETITITLEGEDSVGTLVDGVLTVDLMDMGCIMTFAKEGGSISGKLDAMKEETVTYADAGYYELIRIDSDEEGSSISEEDMALVKSLGIVMYLELLEDGSGILYMEEEMPVTWQDGTIRFPEENMSITYQLEKDRLLLDMVDTLLVFQKGEMVAPVVSEMEQAGFTEFMEVGVAYPYTTACYNDRSKSTTGEAVVVSYEIFEEAEGFPAMEGYEWRTVRIEVKFKDENARNYGISTSDRIEDYYTTRLHDDTREVLEQTDAYILHGHTIIYNGQEMDAYCYCNAFFSDWYTNESGERERTYTTQSDWLVPVGYDGCVFGLKDNRVEELDGTYITDYDPADYLLFRLN